MASLSSTWVRTELERVTNLCTAAPLHAGYVNDSRTDRSAFLNVEATDENDQRDHLEEWTDGAIELVEHGDLYRRFQVRLAGAPVVDPQRQAATKDMALEWLVRIGYPIEGQSSLEIDGTAAQDVEEVRQYLTDGNNRDNGYPDGFTGDQRVNLVTYEGFARETDEPTLLIVRLDFTSLLEVDRNTYP